MAALTKAQVQNCRRVFDKFDHDGSGLISSDELIDIFKALGQSPTDGQVQTMVRDADESGDGMVDFKEFLKMLARIKSSGGKSDELKNAFLVFDKNGDGFITAAELRHVMTNLGEKMSEREVDDMLHAADVDRDGRIDYNEFVTMMTGS